MTRHRTHAGRVLSWIAKAGLLALALLVLAVAAFLYLLVAMPGSSVETPQEALAPRSQALAQRLQSHVNVLALEIGERHAGKRENLEAAASYIQEQLQGFGYAPQVVTFGAEDFRNIQVEVRGRERPEEILVVGAHYDSAVGTPGADDNASGVAGLLEIARALQDQSLGRTVRLIAFTNEERPFFGTDLMGSRVSAAQAASAGENILGMLSLEMIGYYSQEPGSQFYPRIIRRFYPEQGNFLAFVSNFTSRPFLHQAIEAFRRHSSFPSEGMAAPQWLVEDIRRSDNASFWEFGYPAVMVTDTSNFRNPHYHGADDLPNTLDYAGMAQAVDGLTTMLVELARP